MKIWGIPKRKAAINLIGLLLLVPTTQIGCGVFFNVNRVSTFDSILLTDADIPMRLVAEKRCYVAGLPEEPFVFFAGSPRPKVFYERGYVIVGYAQEWSEDLSVRYWLCDSKGTARKAAVKGWTRPHDSLLSFQSVRHPEEVIGDATWHLIAASQRREEGKTLISFVKNNVLVYVSSDGPSTTQLQVARDVARKIETKIEGVLTKNQ